MNKLLKWYRFVGVAIIVAGWLVPMGNTSLGTGLMIGGLIFALADIIGKILSIEVMLWTPLYEALGMSIALVLMLVGTLVICCYGFFAVGIPGADMTPMYYAIGAMFLGALVGLGVQGIKSRCSQ